MQRFVESSAILADDPRIAAILRKVCDSTEMGFVAVARVDEERWTACQTLDQIGFGLDAGDELDLKTTICNEIRDHRRAVVFDSASGNAYWRTHPTPILYGFESYLALPIILSDGTFFGTICAIDPEPRTIDTPDLIATLTDLAGQIAAILESSPYNDSKSVQPLAGIASPR